MPVFLLLLERCFEEPLVGDGYMVRSSASVGAALYPGDAASADSLLSAANAAMCVAKYTTMGESRAPDIRPESEIAAEERT